MSQPRSMRVASAGHAFFAVTMIALGVVGARGAMKGTFPPTWGGVGVVPGGAPAREALAYLCALVSLATGIGLLVPRAASVAARVLLGYLLAWLLVFRLPHVFTAPADLDSWWSASDTSLMIAGAWALTHLRPRMASVFYGPALITFGVAHFVNLKGTADLVPGWLPWHTAWASITGGTFIAAGIAVLVGRCARLAGALSALQMGLFTLLVWVPVVIRGPNAFQWTEFVDSVALTAGAWVVAESNGPWRR